MNAQDAERSAIATARIFGGSSTQEPLRNATTIAMRKGMKMMIAMIMKINTTTLGDEAENAH